MDPSGCFSMGSLRGRMASHTFVALSNSYCHCCWPITSLKCGFASVGQWETKVICVDICHSCSYGDMDHPLGISPFSRIGQAKLPPSHIYPCHSQLMYGMVLPSHFLSRLVVCLFVLCWRQICWAKKNLPSNQTHKLLDVFELQQSLHCSHVVQ